MNGNSLGAAGPIVSIIYLAVMVFYVVCSWKIYVKAGKPGWACIVPIYNIIVYLDIVNRPLWWIVLMFIPVVNIVVMILMLMDFAVAFGKSKGWGIGMLLILGFIGVPILAFGDASYTKPTRE